MVLPRCRSSRAADGCDSTDSAEQDTKQLVPRLEVEEMRLRGETKVGDSGVADVWRYDRVKGVEIEGRANANLSDDKC